MHRYFIPTASQKVRKSRKRAIVCNVGLRHFAAKQLEMLGTHDNCSSFPFFHHLHCRTLWQWSSLNCHYITLSTRYFFVKKNQKQFYWNENWISAKKLRVCEKLTSWNKLQNLLPDKYVTQNSQTVSENKYRYASQSFGTISLLEIFPRCSQQVQCELLNRNHYNLQLFCELSQKKVTPVS